MNMLSNVEHTPLNQQRSASFPCTILHTYNWSGPSNLKKLGTRFQPLRAEELKKILAEQNSPSSPCSPVKTVIPDSNQARVSCSDSITSDDDDTSRNILDTTIFETDSFIGNSDLMPGITWLKETPKKKAIVQNVYDSPMSNLFNKMSLNGDKEDENPKVIKDLKPQAVLMNTPINIGYRPITQKSVLSNTKTTITNQNKPSTNYIQKSLIPNGQSTTKKSLNIQASVKPYQTTLRSNIVSSSKKVKNECYSAKKTDTVLREQKLNIQVNQINKENDKDVDKLKVIQNMPNGVPAAIKSLDTIIVHKKVYIVINKLGEGGSCKVYKCLEQDTLQDRAIKVVNLAVDPATAAGYINEVKMLRALQRNDRVIKMFDFEQVKQTLLVVMEKGDVDFSVFLRTIATDNQIPTHIIICYWIEMLKCVREIHNNGIIHSDLKPSNFLIVGGRLKLIDFGISSQLSSEMTSVIKNVLVGSFNYISPEALLDSKGINSPDNGKPRIKISYKSDVWSLGCILYEMVYKKPPFHAIEMWLKIATIVDRNHTIEYPPVKWVPVHLIEMIKHCLIYDMSQRPTVDDLLTLYTNGNYF